MNVLVLGRGGREHSIIWKLSQSPLVEKIYSATGNAGISGMAELVNIRAENIQELLKFALKNRIDLTFVGPEVSLTEGIVDLFRRHDLAIMGPTREVAQLEGSKAFAKALMQKYDIPTAKFGSFSDEEEAFRYIEEVKAPLVIRADGLAAGKGLIVAKDEITAKLAVNVMMKDHVFGEAGHTVVIEEYLTGTNISCFAFIHNNKILGMTTAEDYKRAYDGDRGPNTGGMGAFSPSDKVDKTLEKKIVQGVITKVLKAMKKEGLPYSGVMFVNLIITDEQPKVTEFNLRFNDPLTQAVLPRLKNDLADVAMRILKDDVKNLKIEWSRDCCLNVVSVSEGYPIKYKKGYIISGLDRLKCTDDVFVFHAGTKDVNGQLVTAGGRIFDIAALGSTIDDARKRVYREMKKVCYSGMHYRKDIGI